jgi:prolyl-tRNA editing enzyme YbaK/EbsC (Cys-tRNA(Pro) deacylase)
MYLVDDQPIAVIVRAGELPHPGAVLAAADARTLRSAGSDTVNALTDFAAPLVCPVLLPDHVRVLADACIGQQDVVYTPTGDGGTALGIPTRWLLTASHAAVAELCAPDSISVDLDDHGGIVPRASDPFYGWR